MKILPGMHRPNTDPEARLTRIDIIFKTQKPTGFARQSYPNPLPDRKALDDIVFDAPGLTEDERREVYWAVAELVKNRLDKAGSVCENKTFNRILTMSEIYNIYCDESCHLENDRQTVMVLGAVWCPLDKKDKIFKRIKEIKQKHGFNSNFEIKWTKVSPAKEQFYLDIVDYFFDDDDLHFRALIVPDKNKLNHVLHNQTHDEFYYKMYFDMLKVIFRPDAQYRVYIDIKDTRGGEKIEQLHEVLCNSMYDFSRKVIERVQLVHSHEIEQLQLADLLIGAISYLHRDLATSDAKEALINRIKERSGYSLVKSTLYLEDKVNLFVWDAR